MALHAWRHVSAPGRRLLADCRGQDVLEYALLSALVGIVGLLVLQALQATIGSAYLGWNAALNAIWEGPAPPG